MKVNAILIDDERKALAILRDKLKRLCPNVIIVAETQSPKEGIKLIKNLKPDLVFLDIAMPEMTGFDMLSEIKEPNFEIIFATAFDNFAIEAINHCAIGYLLKPVDNQDLVSIVNKAIENIEDKSALEKNKLLIENIGLQTFQNKKIVIASTNGLEFVRISDIVHCEGVEGYTRIHLLNNKAILSSNSIGHFNKLFQSTNFYLIHKSHIINLDYIEKYLNEGYVILQGNYKLPVSRNKRKDFLNVFVKKEQV